MNIATNQSFEKIIRTRAYAKVVGKKKAKGLSSHRKGHADKREYSALH